MEKPRNGQDGGSIVVFLTDILTERASDVNLRASAVAATRLCLWYNRSQRLEAEGRHGLIGEVDRGAGTNLISLHLAPSRYGTWLGPAWAAICGAIASGQIAANWQDIFRLLMAIVLMDPLLNAFGSAWSGLRWPPRDSRWLAPRSPIALPYIEAGSPGLSVQRWLNGLLAWWRHRFWPESKGGAISLLLTAAFMVGISLSLGSGLLLLVLVGWALMIARARTRSGVATKLEGGLLAISAMGLPWVAGHLSFGALTWSSVALAICSAAAFLGWLSMRNKGMRSGLWVTVVAQLGIVATLVYLKHPLAAGLVVLALFPQVLLGMASKADDTTSYRAVQASLMAGVLIGAVALG